MISKEKILEDFDNRYKQLINFYRFNYNKIIRLNIYRNIKIRYLTNLKNYVKKIYETLLREKEMKLAEYYRILAKKNKKALIVGINYKNTSHSLNGCINDANSINNLLNKKHNIQDDEICMLTDDTLNKPTRNNILNEYKNLLVNSKSGDVLYFTFSGHGTNTIDYNKDEIDGLDELLYCIDDQCIKDDELKKITDQYLKKDVTVFILIDSCHSGTMMDFKYNYLSRNNYDDVIINKKCKETEGNIYLLSGCKDSQTSSDASINGKFQGAITWAFLTVITNPYNVNLSWKELIVKIRELLKPYFLQTPQLSSGKLIDINSKIFM